jgi:hypothetical protein
LDPGASPRELIIKKKVGGGSYTKFRILNVPFLNLGSSTCIPPVAERTADQKAMLRSMNLEKGEVTSIRSLEGWKKTITIFVVFYNTATYSS